jgi:hypothetical protein
MTSKCGIDTSQQCEDKAPLEVNLIVCHQFSGIELVSPVCVSSGAESYSSPDQKVVFGSEMQVNFKSIRSCEDSFSVLIYELQRKNADQSNEEETTCTQLVIVWEINNSKKFSTSSYLIECDKDCVWDEDKLLELIKHYKPVNMQHGLMEDTWLIYDNKVLMTSLNITHEEECYKLKMTISETSIRDDTQRLRYIDMNRCVSMMTLVTTFTIQTNAYF